MKPLAVFTLAAASLFAASGDRPTGNRTTPPTINSVAPLGVARGTTAELTVEGLNLAKASAIYFSEPGVTGKIVRVKELPDLPDIRLGSNGTRSTIDLGPLPPRNQVTVELDVSPAAEIGLVRFRLLTPLGTSPEGRFLIEPYYGETDDKEPNDSPETAVDALLPTILAGAISKPGDVDYFKIRVDAGRRVVFDNGASQLGSTLQPVVTILAEDQSVVEQFGARGGMGAVRFAHRFEKAGVYYIRIADYQESGKTSHFYRIAAGAFPLALSAWPLGLQLGTTRDIALTGYNIDAKVAANGVPSEASPDAISVRPNHAFNELKLAVGAEPEVNAAASNRSFSEAQSVSLPVTINGRIDRGGGSYYCFHARKDQELILEVNARRLGSDLDSFIEVLDAQGNPIERATVRALWETSTTLSEPDSANRGIRILSRAGLRAGDFVMIGGEIIRIEDIPDSPDSDTFFEAFGGQRIAYFDTSAEAHAIDQPVYKVKVFPPATKFAPNGMPLVHLYYQNDDGGPGYGKDSLLHFTAPAAGDYIVHMRDIRGQGGAGYGYRLTIREPRPDFRLTVSPRNPNVPAGGWIPVTVTAFRMDGFDGPIDVSLRDLPPGVKAKAGRIGPGRVSTTLLLGADAGARLSGAVPFNVAGHSDSLTRDASPDDRLKLVALTPPPDVSMTAKTREIEIDPGKTAEISVEIQRQNGFGGRVPVSVRNLPPGVRLVDIGLNGVLINEQETRRSFTIEARPNAQSGEQLIYVGADVETRSPLPSAYMAAEPILLRVK